MCLIKLFLLLYTKCLSTVSSMYLVFHQQLFHMHLLSFQLLLFVVMSCLVLLHFVLLFLRTLKCQTTMSISHAKLSHLEFSKISNSSETVLQKCLKLCKTWYLQIAITIRQKKWFSPKCFLIFIRWYRWLCHEDGHNLFNHDWVFLLYQYCNRSLNKVW